ncbi:hypothetical protein [Stenotrophomonas acidaminiphila]|uniref:hypothetical protein n=1 Tax=Stenotrophomonas acidaminiphila TaxID=128780 RepID=UPI001FB02E3F|nr:hypothetical protein [Stenotrophomonas acidaminiphila]
MNAQLTQALAAIHTSSALAFGVLAKAMMDTLPAEQQMDFVESITGQLQMQIASQQQSPKLPEYLHGYLSMGEGLRDLLSQQGSR